MKNLVDILNGIVQKEENIETNVIEILHNLSEIVESDIGRDESRLSAYNEELRDFMGGLKNGYHQPEQEIIDEIRSYGIDNSSPYGYGHSIGYNAKNKIVEGQNDIEARSFNNFYEQLNNVALNIKSELEELSQSLKDSYNFLLEQLPKGNGMDKNIGEGLVKILSSYRDLTQGLLDETLNESFIEQLKGKKEPTFDDQLQLGIVYLFRGNFLAAQEQFYEARNKAPNHDLNFPLRDVDCNPLNTNSIFRSAYSRIKFAQEFERAKVQHNS